MLKIYLNSITQLIYSIPRSFLFDEFIFENVQFTVSNSVTLSN